MVLSVQIMTAVTCVRVHLGTLEMVWCLAQAVQVCLCGELFPLLFTPV